jgi:hypothetical protein
LRLPLALGLRPRRPTALLDAAFDAIRFRFLTIATVAVVIQLPLVIVPTLFSTAHAIDTRGELVGGGLEGLSGGGFSGAFSVGQVGAWGWVAGAGGLLAVALTGVGVTHLVSSWLLGHDPSISETLGLVARRSPVLLLAWLISLPIRAAGLVACGVGIVVAITFLFVVSPVVAAEPVGPWRAVKRSFELTNRRFAATLGLVCMIGVVSSVIDLVVNAVLVAVSSGEQAAAWILWLASVGSLLLSLALTALHATWSALAYVDLRVRVEGLDLVIDAPNRLAVRRDVVR